MSAAKPQRGWECPKCGSIYAPWVFSCGRCAPRRSSPGWSPPPSAVPQRFRSTSAPRLTADLRKHVQDERLMRGLYEAGWER